MYSRLIIVSCFLNAMNVTECFALRAKTNDPLLCPSIPPLYSTFQPYSEFIGISYSAPANAYIKWVILGKFNINPAVRHDET